MYTSQPCGAPSGSVPVPSGLIAAAQAAAQATVNGGGSLSDALAAVQSAIQNFLSKNAPGVNWQSNGSIPPGSMGPSGYSGGPGGSFRGSGGSYSASGGASNGSVNGWWDANFGTPSSNVANAARFAISAGRAAARKALTNRQINVAQWTFNRLMVRQPSDYAGMRLAPGQFNQPQNGNAEVMRNKRACAVLPPPPVVSPVVGGFSYVPPPIPLTAPPMVPVPPIPAPPAPPPPGSPADCRTGNLCVDLRNGCVLSSSVSPAQLLACAQQGIVGNYNLYPAIAATGGMSPGGMGALRRAPARPMRRVA